MQSSVVCNSNGKDSCTGLTDLHHMQLPKLLELVGLGYTAWFVYRYLLFKVLLKPAARRATGRYIYHVAQWPVSQGLNTA